MRKISDKPKLRNSSKHQTCTTQNVKVIKSKENVYDTLSQIRRKTMPNVMWYLEWGPGIEKKDKMKKLLNSK